jgi:hypothetical protein
MNRMKRITLRLSFFLVIIAGLVGGWMMMGAWQFEADSLAALDSGDGTDWLELAAGIAEEAIQLFFGFTSP